MELGSLQNGTEHKLRQPPPVMPKPCHYRIDHPSALTPVRVSSSTTSSETPLSPQWSLSHNSEIVDGYRKPMPPPRSSSIPHTEEGETSPQSSSPPTHIYPSPPYTLDPTHIVIPPAMTPPTAVNTLSLQELVEKYSQSLPLQIKVLHGYSGQTSQLTVSSGDYYNVHFVKHQEVVSMRDKLGFTYTIPLNSSFQFGLVYSAESHNPNAFDVHIYEKVADLLTLSPLPRVACATRDVKGSDEKSTIATNEILVIKRVIRPKLRKKSLEVLSLKTQSMKVLPLDCEGWFTLNPRRNQIYLLELVRCIPDVFPCEALMFFSSDASNQPRISPSLLNAVVTLTGRKTETSLIASSVTYGEGDEDSTAEREPRVSEHLVDIPVDDRLSEVMVTVVDTSEYQLQEILNRRTRTLFETFDITRVKSWIDGSSGSTQNLFYASVGKGSEGVGVKVDKPPAAYFQNSTPASSDRSTGREEVLYERVYSPSMDETDSTEQPHSFPVSSNEYATQYEQPNLSAYHTPSTPTSSVPSAGSFISSHLPAKVRTEVKYDLLPSIPQVATSSVHKSLRRSHSQYTLPVSDLYPDCYEDMHSRIPSPSIPRRRSSHLSNESKLEQLLVTTNSFKNKLSSLTHRMSCIEAQLVEMSQMNAVMKRLLEGISALTVQANQLRGIQDHSIGRFAATSKSEVQMEREVQNKTHLEKLDTLQVLIMIA